MALDGGSYPNNAPVVTGTGGGTGGGGGGAAAYSTPWSGNIAFTSVDVFVAAAADLDAIPDDCVAVHFNFGRLLVNAAHMGSMEWFRIPISVYDGLTASAGGSTVTVATARVGRDFPATTATGSLTGRDLYIGKDAANKPIFAGGSTTRGGAPVTIMYETAAVAAAGTTTGEGAATFIELTDTPAALGTAAQIPQVNAAADALEFVDQTSTLVGWINPKATYVADDLHKHLIENGVEKEVTVEFHAGHSRVTTMQVLADIGTALNAAGDPVTTGNAGNFRGWFRRPSDIPNADRVDGSWYCARGIGDFEIQDPDNLHATERWNNYNPFETGGPWEEITDANGDTISQVVYEDADGNLSDWRIVDNLYDAENGVTAVGEIFVVLSTYEVLMCVAYTAHADETADYRAVTYVPPGLVKSIVRFWGKGSD